MTEGSLAGLAAIAASLIAAVPAWSQTAAPAIADYSLIPTVAGSWSYATTATGSQARFLDFSARPQITLTCTRSSRAVSVAKPAAAAAPYLQVWTTSQSRNLPASFNPTTRLMTATVTGNDPLLDAMVMSRGRVAVGISGQPALVVPPWGELGRVVEDCRL